ncbi:HlyD family secretion protein [Pseudomonas sp. NPDC090201]|uniref:HlyD family secretion protein n=1 Tax=Pseudomonas sp. NPDC090201 TaxID=3364475 RepID=UPI003809599D
MTRQFDTTATPATAQPGAASPAMTPAAPAQKPLKAKLRPWLMIGVPLMAAVVGIAHYSATATIVSTDNAYARIAKTAINARVSGQVVEISVEDNQWVRKGQMLYRINPEPFQIAVNRADAQLSVARLRIDSLKASYRQQQAELQSAREQADFDQKEFSRKKALVATDFVSRAVFERAETDLKVSRQRVVSIEQQIANTVVALNGDANVEVDSHPSVREARAQLDEAKLWLSYATVYAPEDGIVAKVDDLQVGNFVNNGAPAFALLSDKHIWVEANFRETEVTHMRVGQSADISIDTYPGQVFKAHVVSMSPGAGSDFSLLPPENATGNWVKVVQRVPVRLELDAIDAEHPLYSGISATVRVDTGVSTAWWTPFKTFMSASR